MFTYKQLLEDDGVTVSTNKIFRVEDRTTIPNEPTLFDWQQYQEWLEAGNTPLPAV